MLLHVRQGNGATVLPFPPPVGRALAQLREASAGLEAAGPGSRQMALRSPRRAP